jgi:hypothetical protein
MGAKCKGCPETFCKACHGTEHFGERGAPVDSLELGYELRRSLNAQVVANIGAADPKNYIFRDVGRVVRYPLQVAGDH